MESDIRLRRGGRRLKHGTWPNPQGCALVAFSKRLVMTAAGSTEPTASPMKSAGPFAQVRRACSPISHNAYPLANTTTRAVQSGRKATAAPAATALSMKSARATKIHVHRRLVDWRCTKRPDTPWTAG